MAENLIREYYIQLFNYIECLNSYCSIEKVHRYLISRLNVEYIRSDIFQDHELKLTAIFKTAFMYADKLSNIDIQRALSGASLSDIVRWNDHENAVSPSFVFVFDCKIEEGDLQYLPFF